ncbi:MAG: NAD(P)-dependent oxidoreductase [Candidatus Bathyarchaeia archaeon]|jgi:3-hydroxyisobutyrate dehydrogenase-like beta-hydroxyacid dehydrogenase
MTAAKQTEKATVGVIGLGLMGSAFASNLLSRGYKVHVYNRTEQKAEPLVVKGATFHPSPKELASSVDIVMTSLTDQSAIDSVALGENGFLNSMRKGSLWIDVSTIDPTASVRHAEEAKKAGVDRLDAPVVGSEDLASRGDLIILVGGSNEVFQRYQSFLNELGKTVVWLGADGNGHKMKLDVNLYLGLIGESFSEALVLSQKQGFDAKTFVDIINKTPHRNAFSEGKGPKIAAGNFDPAFSLNNLLKDLKLADKQATETGARLPMSRVALAEYSKATENGEGNKDFSVIALALEKANKLK